MGGGLDRKQNPISKIHSPLNHRVLLLAVQHAGHSGEKKPPERDVNYKESYKKRDFDVESVGRARRLSSSNQGRHDRERLLIDHLVSFDSLLRRELVSTHHESFTELYRCCAERSGYGGYGGYRSGAGRRHSVQNVLRSLP